MSDAPHTIAAISRIELPKLVAWLARVLGPGDAVLKPVHFIEGTPEAMVESVQDGRAR